MAHSAVDIDRIVHEVIQRLGGAQPPRSAPAHGCAGGELGMMAHVVSLAELDAHLARHRGEPGSAQSARQSAVNSRALANRLQDVKKVLIPRGAIVTPAVRELLHQQKIPLVVMTEPRQSAHAVAVAVGVVAARYDASALVRSLAQEFNVQQLAGTDLVTVVDELADLVTKGGYLGLLFSQQSISALCLANRHGGVRAAAAVDRDAVREALDAVGVNLLIVNPARTPIGELNRVATYFCREGPKPCPEVLKTRLE